MKVRLVLVLLTVGLIWTSSASAIDVPGGTFDEYDVGGSGNWKYLVNIPDDWTVWVDPDSGPWVGNNYGGAYPTLGHTGAQWLDINGEYISQALPGQNYFEGVTYKISVMATTTTDDGQRLYMYFLDGDWDATLLDTGAIPVAVEENLQTWTEYTAEYTATAADAGKPIGIGFWGDGDVYLDTVGFVPEPMTIGLLGLGALMIRRKRS